MRGSWADARDDTGINLVLHQKFTECLPYTRCAMYWMLRINCWVRHFSCLQEASVLSLMGLGFNILPTSSELAWIYRLLPEPLVLLESSQLRPSLPWFSLLPNLLFNKSSAFCNKYCFDPPSMFMFTLSVLLSHLSTCYVHGALHLYPRSLCVCVCVHASSPYPELPNSLKAGTLPFSLDMLTMSCSDSFAYEVLLINWLIGWKTLRPPILYNRIGWLIQTSFSRMRPPEVEQQGTAHWGVHPVGFDMYQMPKFAQGD